MFDLDTFEVFLLSALFLSAFAKFIPLRKEWGDIKFQKIQIIISFALFFLFIAVRAGFLSVGNKEIITVLSGMVLFIVFIAIFAAEVWFLATRMKMSPGENDWSFLISPAINAIVIFGGVFLLLVISVQA